MKQIYFNNEFLNDDQKAFSKEYLLTSGCGGYSSSTIGACNTRKYHGLLVIPQPQIDDNNHVIVAAIDEQITYKQNIYHTGTHQYPNAVYPEGFKNLAEFSNNPVPKWVYNFGDCIVVKELLMPENENVVLVRYTIQEATEKVQLNITPFLAFRSVHELKKASLTDNKKVAEVNNGIKVRLYPGYDKAYIQTSQKTEFISAPDWYYNIEYPMEQKRGYAYTEDLFVPGQFNISLKKGEKLVLYAGMAECNSKTLSNRYTSALKKQPILNNEMDCLQHAAKQFIIRNDNEINIKAGYYWFGKWGRDTFISMPGLLLTTGQTKEFTEIINSSLQDLKNGLLPNVGKGKRAVYNSVDASLWFVWALQQYALATNTPEQTWKDYRKYLNEILDCYKNGTLFNIKMDSDGLISAGQDGVALTWMDAIVNGKPVTPRTGKPVEINALWYNAICFCLEIAKLAGDNDFIQRWESYPSLISESFIATYWDKDKQYLADCEHDGIVDWSFRPNQVFALSMPYSPVPEYLGKAIINNIKDELLTPTGLRTLSPKDKNYKGICEGDQDTRDSAYHQGTIWPWLSGHFAEAYLKEYKSEGVQLVRELFEGCSTMLGDECLDTVPEIYNGGYPHQSVGAVAQAWSIAELLRMEHLLTQTIKNEELYQAKVL